MLDDDNDDKGSNKRQQQEEEPSSAAAAEPSSSSSFAGSTSAGRSTNDDDDNYDDTKKDTTSTNKKNETRHDECCWTDLMGKDVQMKIISTSSSSSSGDAAISAAVQPKDAVVVDFVGRRRFVNNGRDGIGSDDNDDNVGPIFQVATNWLVVVTERDVIPALELAVRFMQVGDVAIVRAKSKYAYGLATRKYSNDDDESSSSNNDYVLPPNSDVMFEVTVKSIISETERETVDYQIRRGEMKKRIGNDVYHNEWSTDGLGKDRAIQHYKRGADCVEYLISRHQQQQDDKNSNSAPPVLTKEQFERATNVLIDCLNNVAACYLRSKENYAAKKACVDVLKHDPNNMKALLRVAKCCLLDPASSYDEVQAAIDAAADVVVVQQRRKPQEDGYDDDDRASTSYYGKELRKLQIELKRRQSEYKKKSKNMFSKMAKEMTASSSSSPVDTNGPAEHEKGSNAEAKQDDESGVAKQQQQQQQQHDLDGKDGKAEVGTNKEDPYKWKTFLFQLAFQMMMVFVVGALSRYFNPARQHPQQQQQDDVDDDDESNSHEF